MGLDMLRIVPYNRLVKYPIQIYFMAFKFSERVAVSFAKRREAIRLERSRGRSVAQVAKKFGITRARVYQILKRAGA